MSNKSNYDASSIINQMDDIRIKLALLDYMELEGEKLIEENKVLQENKIFSLDEKAKKQKLNNIIKSYNIYKLKKVINNHSKRLYKVAAILFFLISIISVSVLNAEAIKIKLFNFIFDIHDKYTSIKLEPADDMETGYITLNLEDVYIPTRIPEGFKLSGLTNNDQQKVLQYSNSNKSIIILQQFSSDCSLNIDTENADHIINVLINDSEGLLVEKENIITITWNYANRLFLMEFINCELSQEEALDIAESVRLVNKNSD